MFEPIPVFALRTDSLVLLKFFQFRSVSKLKNQILKWVNQKCFMKCCLSLFNENLRVH